MNHGEIRALARLLDRLDYYRLLRIESGASPAQVRSAYREARREFHPDAFTTGPPDLYQAVERISRRLIEAYTVLRDPERRAAYDRGLGGGTLRFSAQSEESVRKEHEQRSFGSTPNGRRYFALAREAEQHGDLTAALTHLRTALTFEPSNPTFRERLADLQARSRAGAKR